MKKNSVGYAVVQFTELALVVLGLSALLYGIFSDNTELFEKPPSYTEGYLVDAKKYHECITLWEAANKAVMVTVTPDVEWGCSQKARVYPK